MHIIYPGDVQFLEDLWTELLQLVWSESVNAGRWLDLESRLGRLTVL